MDSLDIEIAWPLIQAAANEMLRRGEPLRSQKEGKTYPIIGIEENAIIVERDKKNGGTSPHKISKTIAARFLGKLRAAGGSRPRGERMEYSVARETAIVSLHPHLRYINNGDVILYEGGLPTTSSRLSDEEADSRFNEDQEYIPQGGDERQEVLRQIKERRGQQKFRDALRGRYGDRCLVTGCEVLAVLEAAHIRPYRREADNHPQNGLLLRADIHTLFDLDLLGVEPEELMIEVSPELEKDAVYGELAGRVLNCPHDQRPSRTALRQRYRQFQQRKR